MNRWEYKFVICNQTGSVWKPELVDGRKLADWKNGPTKYEYFARLGEDGWEMVGFVLQHVAVIAEDKIRYVFKRPKG